MKKITLTLCTVAFLLFACNNEKKEDDKKTSDNKEVKMEEPWVPIDSATMMAKMMEYGTPGPMHTMMASWDGTWNGDMTMWNYEGAPPEKSTGTAVNSMILGGKYQITTHSGNMMGMPFEGRSITAFDNATKQFTSTWIDSWSTGIMSMSGPWDEATKTMTLTGSMPDICRPGKECQYSQKFKIVDDNTQQMEMWGPDPKTGKQFKMMDMKMTRKK